MGEGELRRGALVQDDAPHTLALLGNERLHGVELRLEI